MPLAKTIIKRNFPKVRRIIDAKESLNITVIPQDAVRGRKKDPMECALVKACIRQRLAEAAIIGLGYSYLIKGDTAYRYKTSQGVAREITSFDRHQDFAPGVNYKLSKVGASNQLGAHQVVGLGKVFPGSQIGDRSKFKSSTGPHTTERSEKDMPVAVTPAKAPSHYHYTSGVRVMRHDKQRAA